MQVENLGGATWIQREGYSIKVLNKFEHSNLIGQKKIRDVCHALISYNFFFSILISEFHQIFFSTDFREKFCIQTCPSGHVGTSTEPVSDIVPVIL